jgi:hypothetical protein
MPRGRKAADSANLPAVKQPRPKGPELDPDKVYRLAELFTPKPERVRFDQWIIGTSPLICHAFPQKAKIEMLKKQVKASEEKKAREPEKDFLNSLYEMQPGQYGFPATGVKLAICAPAHAGKGVAKTGAKGVMANLWIRGKWHNLPTALPGAICSLPLIRIWGHDPVIREDAVRLQNVTSLGYRGQFNHWAMKITGSFNPKAISPASLMKLISEGGEGFGLGDWRTERKGVFGGFRCALPEEMEAWDRFARGQGPMPPQDLELEEEDYIREAAE